MNAFGAAKPTIETSNSSAIASSMSSRGELDVLNEYLKLAESASRLAETSSFRFP